MAVITVAKMFCYITLMRLLFSWFCCFLLSFCRRNHDWNGGLFIELCSVGVGPALNFFVSLCVNRPPVFQLQLFSKPGDDCFFGTVSKTLQTLQPLPILIGEKKNPDRLTSFMVLLAQKWETDAGDLSWLGWAALELAPVPKCDLSVPLCHWNVQCLCSSVWVCFSICNTFR